MEKKGIKIRVQGRVQGVFYRSSAKDAAQKLNLTGWIRNEENGDVLIVAEGIEQDLLRFAKWCRKGPEFAKVDNLTFELINPTGDYDSFMIRR